MNILLIEDEKPVAQAIIRLLTDDGYRVDWVPNGADGLSAAQTQSYDLILLDILLPGMKGWEVCNQLRERQINTQIMILSAMNEPGDAARGLDAGADDYLSKPFDPSELLARVRARVRTGTSRLARRIQVGDLELDRVDHKVQRNGRGINLTRSEFAVLARLASDAGKTIPAQVLARDVEFALDPLDDPLDSCLKSLSQKIDDSSHFPLIHRSADGYVLESRSYFP